MRLDFQSHGRFIDRRVHRRVDAGMVAVVGTNSGKVLQCRLRDISLTGACMESEFILEKDSDVWLLLRIPGSNAVEHVLTSARVVRFGEQRDADLVYGVSFEGLPERGRVVLDEYVMQGMENVSLV